MVLIDMKMPKRCLDCPCSYWIRTGADEGKLMCNVKEYCHYTDKLVDDYYLNRPSDCPMREVEVP